MTYKDGECVKALLCPVSLGIAFGVTKGLFLLLFAWSGWLFHYGTAFVERLALYYHGYDASFVGGLIGGAWGLVGGFIFGLVVGLIYDFCVSRCGGCSSK